VRPQADYWDHVGEALASLDKLEGASYNRRYGVLTLHGPPAEGRGPYHLDDLMVALKAALFEDRSLGMTIDPDPENPRGPEMIVRYFAGCENTAFGWVLFECDRMLKSISHGEDSLTGEPLEPNVPEFFNVLQLGLHLSPQQTGEWNRFWLTTDLEEGPSWRDEPRQSNRYQPVLFETQDGTAISFYRCRLFLRTEVMELSGGKPVPLEGRESQAAERFAKHFSIYFDDFARLYPEFARADALSRLVVLAEWIVKSKIPLDVAYIKSYQQQVPVRTPTRTPASTVSLEQKKPVPGGIVTQVVQSYGGVDFEPRTFFASDVNGEALKHRNLAEGGLAEHPTEVAWTGTKDGRPLRVVTVPTLHTQFRRRSTPKLVRTQFRSPKDSTESPAGLLPENGPATSAAERGVFVAKDKSKFVESLDYRRAQRTRGPPDAVDSLPELVDRRYVPLGERVVTEPTPTPPTGPGESGRPTAPPAEPASGARKGAAEIVAGESGAPKGEGRTTEQRPGGAQVADAGSETQSPATGTKTDTAPPTSNPVVSGPDTSLTPAVQPQQTSPKKPGAGETGRPRAPPEPGYSPRKATADIVGREPANPQNTARGEAPPAQDPQIGRVASETQSLATPAKGRPDPARPPPGQVEVGADEGVAATGEARPKSPTTPGVGETARPRAPPAEPTYGPRVDRAELVAYERLTDRQESSEKPWGFPVYQAGSTKGTYNLPRLVAQTDRNRRRELGVRGRPETMVRVLDQLALVSEMGDIMVPFAEPAIDQARGVVYYPPANEGAYQLVGYYPQTRTLEFEDGMRVTFNEQGYPHTVAMPDSSSFQFAYAKEPAGDDYWPRPIACRVIGASVRVNPGDYRLTDDRSFRPRSQPPPTKPAPAGRQPEDRTPPQPSPPGPRVEPQQPGAAPTGSGKAAGNGPKEAAGGSTVREGQPSTPATSDDVQSAPSEPSRPSAPESVPAADTSAAESESVPLVFDAELAKATRISVVPRVAVGQLMSVPRTFRFLSETHDGRWRATLRARHTSPDAHADQQWSGDELWLRAADGGFLNVSLEANEGDFRQHESKSIALVLSRSDTAPEDVQLGAYTDFFIDVEAWWDTEQGPKHGLASLPVRLEAHKSSSVGAAIVGVTAGLLLIAAVGLFWIKH
jgi:hypothetical protein